MAKILIADDSKFMRKILTNILNKAGYTEIVEAGDGAEAIEVYRKEKPDLVLLDIIMEKKDGIEVLKDIMKLDKKAKVIMVTAIGQEQSIKEAMSNGALDYITKPFDESKINAAVKSALR